METEEILTRVREEINKWSLMQNKLNRTFEFSVKSIQLIVFVIESISLDRSITWRVANNYNYKQAQEYAITLIPNALNEVLRYNPRLLINADNPITVSSWELIRAISHITTNWCFIPSET